VASSLHLARKVVKKNENPRQTYFVQLGLGYMDAQNITGRTAEHFIGCGARQQFSIPVAMAADYYCIGLKISSAPADFLIRNSQ
jgi:hypothetical protein